MNSPLFSFICIFHQPSNTAQLWDTFKDNLSEDYFRIHKLDIAYQFSLRDINETFKLHGFSLSTFNLPVIKDFLATMPIVSFNPNLNYDLMIQQANNEQLLIINEIIQVIQQNNINKSNAYFLDGSGGTGKTFVYQCLIQKCFNLKFLPVVPHASRQTIAQNCIKFSPVWSQFKIFKLLKNMRARSEELEFANFLLKIGNGDHSSVTDEPSAVIDIPSAIIVKEDIVSEIFGKEFASPDEVMNFSKFAILAPKNDHCDEINSKVIDLIPGAQKTY